MATTKKLEQTAAIRLEPGKLGGSGFAYGTATPATLGANNAFPYSSININGKTDFLEDDSISGVAQKDVPVLTKKNAPLESWEGNVHAVGMNRWLYWALGYEDGGSSPQDLGSSVYRHLYEMDKYERHFTAYRTAEQTAVDYAAADRKNRYLCLGLKKGTNDYRFPFLLCSGFGFKSSAGGPLMWNAKGNAYQESRSDYSSSTWTLPAGSADSSKMYGHHHLALSLGPSGALVDVAVTDFSVSAEIPLFLDQDSESGLFVAEPVLNGKYALQCSITLARHSVDTYKAYRDAFTACCMKAVYTIGSYEFGIYLPDMRIVDAPDTGDEVARHPLTFVNSKQPAAGNPFATEIGTCDLIQTGELFVVTKDNSSVNEMRRE